MSCSLISVTYQFLAKHEGILEKMVDDKNAENVFKQLVKLQYRRL